MKSKPRHSSICIALIRLLEHGQVKDANAGVVRWRKPPIGPKSSKADSSFVLAV